MHGELSDDSRVGADGYAGEKMSNSWYAIRVRSRFENSVATLLQGKGYESFLPFYNVRRRWSDRFKVTKLPLFPGYLFCRFNPSDRLPVLTVPGIVHIIGAGNIPLPVDEAEIAAIQAAVQSGLPRQPWPVLQAGDRVKVVGGPLAGIEGILLNFKGQKRLVLSVTLLQRSVAVEINEEVVLPLRLATSRYLELLAIRTCS